MYYDEKYNDMPLRGKSTFYGWLQRHNRKGWFDESRKSARKYHNHYDLYKDWWKEDINVAWSWKGVSPSKGHKRKTWRDYNG